MESGGRNTSSYARHVPDVPGDLAPETWRLESKTTLNFLDRIRTRWYPIGRVREGALLLRYLKTGLNDAFVVSREKRDELIDGAPLVCRSLKAISAGAGHQALAGRV